MKTINLTMNERIARKAGALQKRLTGLRPTSVTVIQSDGTLVITLHGALSPAERALARTPAGAAKVQEFHRQLFATNADSIRNEIRRITGVEVRQATAEIEPSTGSIVAVFATGTVVQVFLLKSNMLAETWNAGWAATP